MRTWTTHSVEETQRVGRELAAELPADAIVLLYGDMGSGKTVLTQGLASGLGIDPSEVQSPTFTLMREHQGPHARLVHVDLYRLEPAQAATLGLEEILDETSIKVIEWADRLPWTVEADVALDLSREGEPATRSIRERSAEATAGETGRRAS